MTDPDYSNLNPKKKDSYLAEENEEDGFEEENYRKKDVLSE